ncbi:MAG: hypothetical protein DI582_09630 [Azospirillum brasilense]|nr:MAG: hypothetical protein DI582_09630 [Azospirillum brasilense]
MSNRKFTGSYQDLQDKVLLTGIDGEWREINENHKQYKAETGAVLNWWSSSKTIQFQGSPDKVTRFETAFWAAHIPA